MPEPFLKPALSIHQHIEKLKARGLLIENEAEAAHYLKHISYYRLGPYLRAFQLPNKRPDHVFKPGTRFQDALKLYIFDRELRLIFLDVLERIEVSIRTCISNHMSETHGPHWFLQPNHFAPGFKH